MSLTVKDRLRAQFAQNQNGFLEWIARDNGLSTLDVVELLPEPTRTILGSERLPDVLEDLTHWGELFIIVQTGSIVAEIVSHMPSASVARGHYNFAGGHPFGGHLRQDACKHIVFIERMRGERLSKSLQLFDVAGESILKVFVRRDEARELLAHQVARFDALKGRLVA
ncbi:MAG: heme utilization cystosolic carrier protein HutX [Pseudomonadota bacterium]